MFEKKLTIGEMHRLGCKIVEFRDQNLFTVREANVLLDCIITFTKLPTTDEEFAELEGAPNG
jgi:hypothetical protein